MSIKVGILGTTGYTGVRLFSILLKHPEVRIRWITSEKYAGKEITEPLPCFKNISNIVCSSVRDLERLEKVDLVFSCLPDGISMKFVNKLYETGIKLIDLSPDLRFSDPEIYRQTFGIKHRYPELLVKSVYGLSEINRKKIRQSVLVSNPGCYSTSVLLPLIPLLRRKDLFDKKFVIDIKASVSGAGRAPRPQFHFPEININTTAENISGHTQKFEIQNIIRETSGEIYESIFTTHMMPLNRGILATVYLKLSDSGIKADEIFGILKNCFAREQFIRIIYPDRLPALNDVCGSNYLDIGFELQDNFLIIVSALDNLIKGASGQAVQNMNIMFGFPENSGLENVPYYV